MAEQTVHQKKKVDAKELIELLSRLPEDQKLIIFGMVKGVELSNQTKPVA